jgi:hypothetical protein
MEPGPPPVEDASDLEVYGPSPAFPAVDAPRVHETCRAYVRFVPAGPPQVLDVLGCDTPFAEAVRAAVPGLSITQPADEEPEEYLRLLVTFRRHHGADAVDVGVQDVVVVTHRSIPPYPTAAQSLDLKSIDCHAAMTFDGATGRVVAADLGDCPVPYQAVARDAVLRWRFEPFEWQGAPPTGKYWLRIRFKLVGGTVDAVSPDAEVAWTSPPYPAGHADPGAIPQAASALFEPVEHGPIDWSDLHGAMPMASTECPVVVYLDATGAPYWFDMNGCPSALQEATWAALSTWRWSRAADARQGEVKFKTSLTYAPPS